jgi:hypothetical protein
MCDAGKKSWAYHLKSLLCDNGFIEAWQQQGVGDARQFLCALKERLLARFLQDWEQTILTNDRFEFYALFKRTFQPELYMDYGQLRCYKIAYVQFRFGFSPIRLHKLRYKPNATPQQFICPVCEAQVEDERHVLLECAAYADLRAEFLMHDSDLAALMEANDEQSVCNLSRFLYKVFKLRAELLQRVP